MTTYPVRFIASLRCIHCGELSTGLENRLVTHGMHPDPGPHHAEVGDVLHVEDFDIEDSYHRTRAPLDEQRMEALEQWVCPRCGHLGWARLVFTPSAGDWKVASIVVSELTPAVLREVPLISDDLELVSGSDPSMAWVREFLARD